MYCDLFGYHDDCDVVVFIIVVYVVEATKKLSAKDF